MSLPAFNFKNLSIRRKQMFIIMLTSSAALLLACAAFVVYDVTSFRKALVLETSTTADIIGNSCTAALDFNDPESAQEALAVLKARPGIIAACIYDRQGNLFASYRRDKADASVKLPPVKSAGHEFVADELHMFKPIAMRGDTIGVIYLGQDLEQLKQLVKREVGIVALVLLVSMFVAFIISIRLQQFVSDPILHLAKMTRAVAVDKNYSVRALKSPGTGQDELGQLIDGFNEMLVQIQTRDAELQKSRESLEERVKERTAKLEESLSLLNATLESTADGVLVMNGHGNLTSYNTKFAQMWRLPQQIIDTGDEGAMLNFVVGQLKEEETFVRRVQELYANPERECRDILEFKDGRVFERYSQPQRLGDSVVGRVWCFRDVTERVRAEGAVRESQALYHSLVDQMPAGVYRKNKEGQYVFVNSWFCNIKNMDPDQILGRTPLEITASQKQLPTTKWQAEIAERGDNQHKLIMQTGETVESEESYCDETGKKLFLRVVRSPVYDSSGKITGTQGMLFDITASKEAEAELDYERELFRTLLDHSPDSIFFKDLQSRLVNVSRSETANLFKIALNRHRETHPGESEEQLPEHLTSLERFRKYAIGKSDADFYGNENARVFNQDEQEIIRTGRPLIGKMEQTLCPDGSSIWHMTTKVPWRNKEGQIIGTFGTSKDVSDLKNAQEKIEETHKQLLETSRKAGMAEIATNVLRNVGNVLNSVNVSASVAADSVRKSKVSSLSKVVALLNEHERDLGAFFGSDPRGKQLPAYLAQLASHFLEQQLATIQELDSLRSNIEHIEEIVAMQQTYARVSGVSEFINIRDLVEDSLRMNLGSLDRHGVEVIREFSDVPSINIDKHKVLQILVNLLRNAKHACQDSERNDKRLTVRITNGDDRIKISVIDNGVGIAPENMASIFNHGFTTRKDGHGFGLHSGAIAARELGGSLTVQSDGLGQGAAFTLELPVEPASRKESSTV